MPGGKKGNKRNPGKKRPASRSKSRRRPTKAPREKVIRVPPFRLLPVPISPAKDSAEYRQLVLANNLKVLLISTPQGASWDPEWTLKFPSLLTNDDIGGGELNCTTKLPSYLPANYPSLECGGGSDDQCSRTLGRGDGPKCCICVTIGAGSFSDPPNFQGLAHYVEHLVHHGTESYTGENSFSDFVEKRGGYTNAFTDKNVTNYHAVVDFGGDTVLEMCKRYTSMLTEPLMTLDSVTREIESVDNEYFMRKVAHCFRHNHLLHVSTISDPDHPMRKFSIGCKEGLMNPQVDNSNVLLQEASLRFVKTHYFAENMSLVIQGPESLDALQRCAVDTFSKIPQKSQFPQESKVGGTSLPYNVRQFNRLFTAKPSNMDGHTLYLAWALSPEVWKNYKCHTLQYLYTALGHDAPGGLSSYLRNKGFILSLNIPMDGGIYFNDYATIFQIYFVLTQRGRDSIDEVLEATFSYMKLHQSRGAQRSICNQIKSAEKVQLENMEMEKSVYQFIRISTQMQHCDPSDVIVGSATPKGSFNTTKINECLSQLTPERANYFLFTSDTGTENYMLDNIYGTNYLVQDLPVEMKRRFTNVEIFPEFSISPPSNPFLSQYIENDDTDGSDNEIITSNESISSEKVTFNCLPCVGMASEQVNLWLMAKFGISSVESRIHRPAFDVMSVMLKLQIFPHLYHQVDVGFCGSIRSSFFDGALFFSGSGLPGRHITESMIAMIEGFENFPRNTNEETFKMAKEAVLRNYFALGASPLSSARDLSLRLKHCDYLTVFEAHDQLLEMSFTYFLEFMEKCKEEICFVCQSAGNIRRCDAAHLYTTLQNFRCRAIPEAKLLQLMNNFATFKRIPLGEKCLRMRSLMAEDKVFIVANKYQMSRRNHKLDMMSHIIYGIMRGKLVFQLRTIEQLGYVVHSEFFLESDFSGFTVYVCAHLDKHSPCYVDSRIEQFLAQFFKFGLTDENVAAAAGLTGITRGSAEPIRQHFKKFLLFGSGSGKSKLSLQITPSRPDGHCLCQHKQNGIPCKNSDWLPPVARIGKERTEVSFARARNPQDNGNYFITSIDDYHRSA